MGVVGDGLVVEDKDEEGIERFFGFLEEDAEVVRRSAEEEEGETEGGADMFYESGSSSMVQRGSRRWTPEGASRTRRRRGGRADVCWSRSLLLPMMNVSRILLPPILQTKGSLDTMTVPSHGAERLHSVAAGCQGAGRLESDRDRPK